MSSKMQARLLKFCLPILLATVALAACKPKTDEPPPSPAPADEAVKPAPVIEQEPAGKTGEGPAAAEGSGFTSSFDDENANSVPPGVKLAETAGMGSPAIWTIVEDASAPSPPMAFGTTESKNYGHTFNVALFAKTGFTDVDLSVEVRSVSGEEDRGGGPVWRAVDADNYYICRWNPLENNFRVYFVKQGRRKQIASLDVEVDPAAWHVIRIVMKGKKIEAWLDGGHHLEVEDDTFEGAGMVGLWTKADACALFDDIAVETPE